MVALPVVFGTLLLPFLFFFLVGPESGGSAGGDPSRVACRLKETRDNPPFRVNDFLCQYGTNLDLHHFAAMQMNGNSAVVQYGKFWHYCNTAVGVCNYGWGHGMVMVPRSVVPSRLVWILCWRVFTKGAYKMALGQLVVETTGLAMSKTQQAIEILRGQRFFPVF